MPFSEDVFAKDFDVCAWFAIWLAGVCLANASFGLATELVIHEEPVPMAKALKLREAAAIGQITTTMANPEPYTYISTTVRGVTLRTVRGVILGRRASWYGKREPLMPFMPEPETGAKP